MKNKLNAVRHILLGVLIVALTACGSGGVDGSGGDTSTSAGNSLSGLAATGTAISHGVVTAHCISGPEINGVTNANGVFNLQLTPSHSLPCLLNVTGGAPTVTLYSFSSTSGQVNITPVTDLIVTRALGTGPGTVFGVFNASHATLLSNSISAAKAYVLTQLRNVTGDRLQQDPMNGTLVVGDADHEVLDALGHAMTSAGKTIVDLRVVVSTGGDVSSTVPPVSPLDGRLHQFDPAITPVWRADAAVALLNDNTTLIFSSYGLTYQALPISLLRLSSTGVLLETIQVANHPYAFRPQVQADEIGGAFVAWLQSELVSGAPNTGEYRTFVHLRRFDRATGLGADTKLDTGIDGQDSSFKLLVRPNGSAVIAWVRQSAQLSPTGRRQEAVYVSEYSDGAGWSTGSQVSPLVDYELSQFSLATSPNGNTMVLWTENTPVVINPDSPATMQILGKLVSRYKASGATWQNATVVEDDRSAWGDHLRFSDIQLSVGNPGNAMLIWEAGSQSLRNGQYGLKINRFEASTGWLGTVTYTQSGRFPNLAMNGNGHGFLSWTTDVADPPSFFAARFDESGWQGTVTQLDQDSSRYAGGAGALLLIDNDGNALSMFGSVRRGAKASDDLGVIRVRRYSTLGGWGTTSTLPPYDKRALLINASKLSGGKTTTIWTVGKLAGDPEVPMMLNFTVAQP